MFQDQNYLKGSSKRIADLLLRMCEALCSTPSTAKRKEVVGDLMFYFWFSLFH
jgi:hypothetical protein